MDIATIAIWIALLLIGLGVVAIALFGLKSIASGKFRRASLIAIVVPIVVFIIAYLMSAGAEEPIAAAAVLTSVILLILASLAILVTGLRGLVGM